jgi:hypothetical protein
MPDLKDAWGKASSIGPMTGKEKPLPKGGENQQPDMIQMMMDLFGPSPTDVGGPASAAVVAGPSRLRGILDEGADLFKGGQFEKYMRKMMGSTPSAAEEAQKATLSKSAGSTPPISSHIKSLLPPPYLQSDPDWLKKVLGE